MQRIQNFLVISTILLNLDATASFKMIKCTFVKSDGTFYKSTSTSGSTISTVAPSIPSPDPGAPLSEHGWNWIGWARSLMSSVAKEGSTITYEGVTDVSFAPVYSRTNYFHYYDDSSSTSATTKSWVQKYRCGEISTTILPRLVTPSTYNWIPKGWTATDKVYSSKSDILYSSTSTSIEYHPANTNQNIRAVYNRTKTILFNANGASNGSVANKVITQWFVVGKGVTGTITLPENGFTRTGYVFNGWNTSSTATSGIAAGTIVMPDGAWTSADTQTYYATWKANKYTISYDANGGTGLMEDTIATYDMPATVSNNCFTRQAYVFKGWATEHNGDVVYLPGQTVKNLTTEGDVTVALYAVWEPLVVPAAEVSVADGTTFCGDSYKVTLSCPLDGTTIYYTTNGVTPRTSTAFAYTGPIVFYGSVNIVAIAVKDGVKSGYTRVSIEQIAPNAPVVTPADGTEFRSEICEVTISCVTEGAEIYYTLDGSTPDRESATKYTAPFTIAETTTIKAVAVGGPFASEIISAKLIKRSLSLAEAAGATDLTFTTDENAPWQPIVDASAAIGFAAQSGTIGMDSSSWMETAVSGKGTLSFKWRVECEEDDSGSATWDRLVVLTNDVEVARIDGIREWSDDVILHFGDSTVHTVRWVFVKDDYDEEEGVFADHGWVSDITWTPDDPLPPLDAAATDNDAKAIIAGLADARLPDSIVGKSAYAAFRNWVDGRGLSHALVKDAPNAWFSYALDAPGLMAKPEPLASEDVVIESITPSSTASGTFDLTVSIAGAEIGEGARLAEVLGIEGAAKLKELAFSSDGLTVNLGRTADGKVKATVTPDGAPPVFFLRARVK